MRIRNPWLVALAVLSGAGITALAGSSDLLDDLLQRPADASGTVIVPDHHLRRWDPITVFFPSSRGRPGPEDQPGEHVELHPDQPGAWTWLDAKTLQFRPAEPWSPMDVTTVRTRDARVELFTLAPPPTATTPRDESKTTGPVERIELTFANPIDPRRLAKVTRIEVRPLPGLSDDGLVVLGPDDFEIKALLRGSSDAPASYAVVLNQPIERGAAVRVNVGLSLAPEAEDARATFSFQTPEPFRAVELGCAASRLPITAAGTIYPAEQPLTCTGARRVEVRLSAPPNAPNPIIARNLVRFEPAIDDFSVQTSGRSLLITGAFEDDQLYRVSLHPAALEDTAGRNLQNSGESAAHLVFPHQDPYVRWSKGRGILERHGPKRVPVEGRGFDTIDLRIHRIEPTNRELWPFPASPVAVAEDGRPPSPGEEPEPLDGDERVTASGLASRLRALGSPAFSDLVDLPLQGAAGRGGLDLTGPLAEVSGSDRPGHYLVGVRQVEGDRRRHWMRVQVTDLSLTTVEGERETTFLVTSLRTGRPVAGATVVLDGPDRNGRWVEHLRARTDGNGRIRWDVPGSGRSSVARITVLRDDDVLVLDGQHPPDTFRDGTWHADRSAWLDWAFRDLDRRAPSVRDLGHLFPDRPVYRPEEEVHLKGYARKHDRGRLTAITGSGRIEIQGPGATWTLPVTLSPLGSFDATWSEEDVPTGSYQARFVSDREGRVASTSFRVEAYRLPTFEVDLTTSENRSRVPNDTPFDLLAAATYYAGGEVANRPIRWSVTQYPLTWSPDGPEGFRYSSDGRFSRADRFDSTPSFERSATTDARGQSRLTLDPGIEPNAQPRTYVVEATVTDADEQTVTTTHRVDAVPAFVLGLKAPRYLERAGELPIEVVAVGPDGVPIAGEDVTVRLVQRQWHSVLQASDFTTGVARYLTDTVDVPVEQRDLTTTGEPTALTFDLDGPGVYVVEIEARDELGRVQVVTTDLFAGGSGAVGWARSEEGTFRVTSTRPTWRPGEKASLILQSPFPEGEALVVVETPSGHQLQSTRIDGGKATITIPVEEGWVPRIPVHVLLRRGRVEGADVLGATDLGRPQTVATTHWLQVDPIENTVEVALDHPERAMPGETIPITVELSDPDGAPLAGEVTLWLVDQAVLALGREQPLDPRPDFIRTTPSRARLRTSRNLTVGRLPYHQLPGGDGEEDAGEAESLLSQTSVRRNFQSVPYWEPRLQVPASGRLTVDVPLPDNLTVFKVRAKAISGPSRFGAEGSSLRVRLPVVLQPDLPRFVRPGDQLSIGALARVVEGDGGAGTAEIETDGLELQGPGSRAFQWDPESSTAIAWKVRVPTLSAREGREHVTVTVGARRDTDGAKDAVQVRLPLEPDRLPRSRRQVVELAPSMTGDLFGPGEAVRPGSLSRSVVLADHPGLVRMAAGLDVLTRRPSGSAGARIDRLRAWVGLGGLLQTLGPIDEARIDATVAETLAFLRTSVDGRGRVASWPGGRGRIALTADALELLVDLREAGRPTDADLQTTFIRELKRALRSDYGDFVDGADWYERSRALEALARAGEFSEPTFTELGEKARYLGPLGRSSILLAASSAGRSDGRLAGELLADLRDDVVVGLYQGEERYQGLKSSGNPTSPFVGATETLTLAEMTRSLLAAAPTDPHTERMVDALVRLGGEDGWGGRADAPALLALANRLQNRSAQPVTVLVGDRRSTASEGATRLDLEGPEDLVARHEAGPTAVLYARSRWIPAEPGSEADPIREGFVVDRTLRNVTTGERVELDEGGRELDLALGDILEEHIQVTTPEDHAFVQIRVPIAAAVEPLNPALHTSPPEARPSESDTRSPTWRSFGDAEVLYAFEWLPKGTYDFRFRTRVTTPGRFIQPPARAELVFEPAVSGQSPGAWVVAE